MSKKRNEVLRKQLLKKRLAARAKSADKQSSGAPVFTKIIIGILVVILFGGVFIYFDGQRAGQAGLVPEKSLGLGEKLDVKLAGNNWKVQLDSASKTTIELEMPEVVPPPPVNEPDPSPPTTTAIPEFLPPNAVKKQLKQGECILYEVLPGKKYNICVKEFFTTPKDAIDVAVLEVKDSLGKGIASTSAANKLTDIYTITGENSQQLVVTKLNANTQKKTVTLVIYHATAGLCTGKLTSACFMHELKHISLDLTSNVPASLQFPAHALTFSFSNVAGKGVNIQISNIDGTGAKSSNNYFLKPDKLHYIDVPVSKEYYNVGVYKIAVKPIVISPQKVYFDVHFLGYSSPVKLPTGTYYKKLHPGECFTFIDTKQVGDKESVLCFNGFKNKNKEVSMRVADKNNIYTDFQKPVGGQYEYFGRIVQVDEIKNEPATKIPGTLLEGDSKKEWVVLKIFTKNGIKEKFSGASIPCLLNAPCGLSSGGVHMAENLKVGSTVKLTLPQYDHTIVIDKVDNTAGSYTFSLSATGIGKVVREQKVSANEKVVIDIPAAEAPGFNHFYRLALEFSPAPASNKNVNVKMQFLGFPSAQNLLDTGIVSSILNTGDPHEDCFSFSYGKSYILCTTIEPATASILPIAVMKIVDSNGKAYPEIKLVIGKSALFQDFAKVTVDNLDTDAKRATIVVKLHENPLELLKYSKEKGITGKTLKKTVKDSLTFTIDEKPYELVVYGKEGNKYSFGIRDITQSKDTFSKYTYPPNIFKLDDAHYIGVIIKGTSPYDIEVGWEPLEVVAAAKKEEVAGGEPPQPAEPTLTNTLDTAVALNQEYVFKVGGELTNLKITKETGSKVAGGNNYGNTGVVIQIGGKKSQTILWEKGLVPWGTVGQSTSFTKVVTPGGNAFYLSITKTGGNEYVIWLTSDEFKNALQSNLPGTINSLITFNDKVIVTFTNVKSTAPLVYNVGGTVTLTIDGKKQSFKVTKITHVIGTTRFKNNNFDGTTQYASDNVPVITPLDSAELIVSKVTQQSITVAVEKEFKKKKSAAEQAGQTPQEGISQQGGSVPSGPSGKPFPKVPPGQPGPPPK